MNQYFLDTMTNLWNRSDFDGISYSDGQEIENRILDIVSKTADCSVLSEDLRSQIIDWPTEYHLSRQRHCLLRPLGIKAGDRVLELGCGCGAITRYLGELGADVVSVEGSKKRAEIAAQRCRDLANVRVVLDNLVSFDTEETFDWVLLIGVLEYAPLFAEAGAANPVQKYLASSSSYLADTGRLVVAIENQLGLKYFNGCGEDHVARPFFGINDLYDDKTPVTFGRQELRKVMQQAGFGSLDFYYPWPDYKLPSVILHSSTFTEPDVNISDLLLRCTSRDYMGSTLRVFSEQLAIPVLERNGMLEDMTNSFLVVAEKEKHNHVDTRKFVWICSSGSRQKSLCTETTFLRGTSGAISVEKKRMDETVVQEPVLLGGNGCTVIHRCGSEQLYPGHLLAREIFRKRAEAGSSTREIANSFLAWFEEVRNHAECVEEQDEECLENWVISGEYIDLTPFNFIRSSDKSLIAFDLEWEVEGPVPLGWLLYRAIVWGWFGTVPANHQQQNVISVYNVVSLVSSSSSLSVKVESLQQWEEMEQLFQSVVANRKAGNLPQFLQSSSENYFSFVDKLQLQLSELDRHLERMHQKIESLYSSSSWRYSRVVRLTGSYGHRINAIFRKIHTIGNPVQAVSRVRGIIKQDGWKGIKLRIAYALHGPGAKRLVHVDGLIDPVDANDYPEWIRCYDTLSSKGEEEIHARITSSSQSLLISIVMPVYDPPIELLQAAIESVRNQSYPHWQLCIADDASTDPDVRSLLEKYEKEDGRIKVVFRKRNGHISESSNSALELAEGDFVALMDHDDILPAHALFMVAEAIQQSPDVQLLYSDEDKIDLQGNRHTPSFKCDWNPDLFLSYNFFSHLGVYKTELVRKVGGFRPGFEGAQDYDLALRCVERVRKDQIVHIPHVLYHWRALAGSTALATEEKPYALAAGKKAIDEHIQRNKLEAECELKVNSYRVRYRVPTPHPFVSLIIPTLNGGKKLQASVDSILARTVYESYEILIVVSGGSNGETADCISGLSKNTQVRVFQDESLKCNDARLYNTGVEQARGDIVGLLHDDLEIISDLWLEELVSHACRKEIGAVGARLRYPDGTLQHGGMVLGIQGTVGYAHRGTVKGFPGYRRRAELLQNFSAVSSACLFVEKEIFDTIGGLDDGELGVSLYDVDFCLKLREKGLRNLWTPYAELCHLETGTLDNENKMVPPAKIILAQFEFARKWGAFLVNDPAYSPNLTLQYEDFSFAWPPVNSLEQYACGVGR